MNGYTQDKDTYLKRMRRIEGQVRGIAKMIEIADAKIAEASAAIARLVKSWSTTGMRKNRQ
ncbi:MAG: metal-sensing transcriptional repressor [Pseudonocardia sp.]